MQRIIDAKLRAVAKKAKLTLSFKDEKFCRKRLSQLGSTDALHLKTGQNDRPLTTNGKRS